MATEDSTSGWPRLLGMMRRNERSALCVRVSITLSGTVLLQKMAGGPHSREGLPKKNLALAANKLKVSPSQPAPQTGGSTPASPGKCSGKLKKGIQRVPCLNPDPFKHFIGPNNWGKAIIDGELVTCLLDNGAQLNFMTLAYAAKRNLNVYLLECLAQEIGGPLPPI